MSLLCIQMSHKRKHFRYPTISILFIFDSNITQLKMKMNPQMNILLIERTMCSLEFVFKVIIPVSQVIGKWRRLTWCDGWHSMSMKYFKFYINSSLVGNSKQNPFGNFTRYIFLPFPYLLNNLLIPPEHYHEQCNALLCHFVSFTVSIPLQLNERHYVSIQFRKSKSCETDSNTRCLYIDMYMRASR